MNKNILNQAFITMGYREMKENVYGKPVGYGLILARIDEDENKVAFQTWFNNINDEPMVWGSYQMNLDVNDPDYVGEMDKVESENDLSGDVLYEYYINKIAWSEWNSNVDKILIPVGGKKSWAFKTNKDIVNLIDM